MTWLEAVRDWFGKLYQQYPDWTIAVVIFIIGAIAGIVDSVFIRGRSRKGDAVPPSPENGSRKP